MTPEDIQKQLAELGMSANKRLSQNFLRDERVLWDIEELLDDTEHHHIIEVGPGLGAITRVLATLSERVTAIERDPVLAEALDHQLKEEGIENVNILDMDARDYPFGEDGEPYTLVSNLPFATGTFILRKALEAENPPHETVVIMQKEVAERITVKDGKWSLLALAIHYVAEPHLVKTIPAGAYWPQPEVDTALLHIQRREQPALDLSHEEKTDLFRLIKWGFSAKRKQLANNMAAGMHTTADEARDLLKAAQIDPTIRAERLELADWGRIYTAYTQNNKKAA